MTPLLAPATARAFQVHAADLLDLLLDWTPDPADRQRIPVDDPDVLFGLLY